jgi:hypothetical protein
MSHSLTISQLAAPMYDRYPTDPKRIRERIRRYERIFRQEQRQGMIGHGYGKRFLLGPLAVLPGRGDGVGAGSRILQRHARTTILKAGAL